MTDLQAIITQLEVAKDYATIDLGSYPEDELDRLKADIAMSVSWQQGYNKAIDDCISIVREHQGRLEGNSEKPTAHHHQADNLNEGSK